jgi:hypothetical protein
MKKLFIRKVLMTSILFYSVSYFSQVDLSSTRYGFVAGPTYSRVQNAHIPSSGRTSFYGGAFAIIPIGGDDMFYLQPQVEYLSAGEKGQGSTVYANNYISIPVYIKAYFSEAESEFFGLLGPRFGFLINQNIANPSKVIYNTDQYGKAAGFDLVLSAGLGFSYKRKWEFTGRFDFGLSNTLPDLIGKEPQDPASSQKKRQHVLSAGLSYIFD